MIFTNYIPLVRLFGNSIANAAPICKGQQQKRKLFAIVRIAFNSVDVSRLQEVGPNRLCAEWIVKNGGAVRFLEDPNKLYNDYNSLPPESQKYRLKVADATDSSIMNIGLDHFKGCNHVDTVILHNCTHLEEDGLKGLVHIVNSLVRLQVSGCYNINDEGLKEIANLKNLKQLIIFNMTAVKSFAATVSYIQGQLPNCEIDAKRFKR
ncbi:ATP synthase subunit s, mitochondrial-like [Teleopsis dalmanni]|uniref:ATP synthase subunit s, mitochondrial-like n=1 Tax=Teleopsis dalmanni TaxID=139649 RepID=UPI0018CF2519|nr:ATP synthase subunit s, mitochondrial-like [Teleopsis dalmanni]